MKRMIISIIGLGWLVSTVAQPAKDIQMKTFIDALMQKMTLEEKIGQLNLPGAGDIVTGQASNSDIGKLIKEGKVGALFNIKGLDKIAAMQRIAVQESRLKIPLIFGMDVIHGYETVFPIPLGLSATWNMKAIERSAQIAAIETSASGINWTFSPMVDIARDPRWGRIAEGNGEDPYLGSQIAKAMVRGYQGDLSKNTNIMACVKHYALYGAAEAGRDYNTVDMGLQRMYNDYLPPYKAAVEAGVGSVMASFNDINGVPATGNKWLLTDVLRKQWGFGGFVVTDYTGINEMVDHGIGNLQQVAAQAINAGVDMDMVGEGFRKTTATSVADKKVAIATIDAACRRILEAKYKLGLFANPYKYIDTNRVQTDVFTAAHRKEARDIAAESFVLLKNEKNVLPLKPSAKIALIGPLGDSKLNMPGTWAVAVDYKKSITLYEGLKNALGSDVLITKAAGAHFDDDSTFEVNAGLWGEYYKRDGRPEEEMIAEALQAAAGADVIVAAVGETAEMTGESSSRAGIEIPDVQKRLLKALKVTGKPVVLVLFTGRPLALSWEHQNMDAILNVWFGGTEAGDAIADVLYGKVNPSGKLTATFPRNGGQIPIYYAHKNTGKAVTNDTLFEKFKSNYLDVLTTPLYPFGYGLSYTTFHYGALKLSATQLKGNQILKVDMQVTNNGTVAGAETVQLYIKDVVGSVTRPVKELKAFQKIFLKAGESKTVSFTITPQDLKFYNYELKYDWEPGDFEIMVGTNSRDVQSVKMNWTK